MKERIRYLNVNAAMGCGAALVGSICIAEGHATLLLTIALIGINAIVGYRCLFASVLLQQELEEISIKKERRAATQSTQSNELVKVYHKSNNKRKVLSTKTAA